MIEAGAVIRTFISVRHWKHNAFPSALSVVPIPVASPAAFAYKVRDDEGRDRDQRNNDNTPG
jgi:hypothetical protein